MIVRIVVALLTGLILAGKADALLVTPPVVVDVPATDAGSATPRIGSAPPPETTPGGNPLWAIPLRQLTATAARPLFAPSRRPPPPILPNVLRPAAPPPAPPAEPEKPQLSLVGTVAAGSAEGIGVFVEQGAKNVLRLKMGEDHKGWVLRQVRRGEVTLEKGRETAVLAFPPPEMKKAGAAPPSGAVAPVARPSAPPMLAPASPASAAAPALPPAAAPSAANPNPFEVLLEKVRQRDGGLRP